MKVVSCSSGADKRLIFQPQMELVRAAGAWESWADQGSLARRSVHELLFDVGADHPMPMFPALMLARKALGLGGGGSEEAKGALIWVDGSNCFYPPAAVAAGVPVGRICIVRPQAVDLVWAAVECLRSRGAAAVVAALPPRPSRVEVRRLQLAAEQGGGVGIFLRRAGKRSGSEIYAASTRWMISPAPGERTVQRWSIQLIHGQGGHVGRRFLLEKHRDSAQAYPVYSPAALADYAALPA